MGLLERFFKKNKDQTVIDSEVHGIRNVPDEVLRLRNLNSLIGNLLLGDHYVAKSEYADINTNYSDLIQWFQVLKDSGTLQDYCNKNGALEHEIMDVMLRYNNLSSLIDSQNEQFIKSRMISEKDYLDSILKEIDPAIVLDEDQRRVVLTDEDYCLVVAGAGAGKTTTVAAKVKYLVDRQHVDPKQILVISFTNKDRKSVV